MSIRKIRQNVRTGGSHQPPVADLSPFALKGPRAWQGTWVAQNDRIVVGIDVAKDKVDACIHSLSQRQTCPSGAEGRRKLIAWLRKHFHRGGGLRKVRFSNRAREAERARYGEVSPHLAK